jgi:hypothetical protein
MVGLSARAGPTLQLQHAWRRVGQAGANRLPSPQHFVASAGPPRWIQPHSGGPALARKLVCNSKTLRRELVPPYDHDHSRGEQDARGEEKRSAGQVPLPQYLLAGFGDLGAMTPTFGVGAITR